MVKGWASTRPVEGGQVKPRVTAQRPTTVCFYCQPDAFSALPHVCARLVSILEIIPNDGPISTLSKFGPVNKRPRAGPRTAVRLASRRRPGAARGLEAPGEGGLLRAGGGRARKLPSDWSERRGLLSNQECCVLTQPGWAAPADI